nr:MAG TPA: hypothetical protein [Caudoviricetes sp.]
MLAGGGGAIAPQAQLKSYVNCSPVLLSHASTGHAIRK